MTHAPSIVAAVVLAFASACASGDGGADAKPPPAWAGIWDASDGSDPATATTTTMTLTGTDDSDAIGGNGSEQTGGGPARTFTVSGSASGGNIELVFDGPTIAAAAFVAATERYSFVQVSDDALVLVNKDDVRKIHVFTRAAGFAVPEHARPPAHGALTDVDSKGGARL